MKDFIEDFLVWAVVIGFFAVILAVLFGGAFWLESYQCQSKWKGTYVTEWGPFMGCRANVNGRWIPTENLRDMQ